MITILLGIVIIIYISKNIHELVEDAFFVGLFVSIALIICGILVPMAGFTQPTENVIKLIPLRLEQETDTQYYLEYKDGYYYYAFDNSEEYGLAGDAYESGSIYKSTNVKVYESQECTTPILKVFSEKSKISWYSLAGMWSSKEYVFYIPVDTIHVPE